MYAIESSKIPTASQGEKHIMDNNENQTPYWNERTAIHHRMNQLQGEMNAVRDEYERLFDRLRDLDRIDAQKKHEQPNFFSQYSTPTPTPFYNQAESDLINSTEDIVNNNANGSELDKQSEKMQQLIEELPNEIEVGKQSEEVKHLIEELPKEDIKKFMSPEVISEILEALKKDKKVKSDVNTNEEIIKEPKQKKISATKRTEKNKKVLSKKDEIKARKEVLIGALKESEGMRAKDLSALLEERDLKVNNITSFLTELAKEVKQVQRVDRGVYAWVEEPLDDINVEATEES